MNEVNNKIKVALIEDEEVLLNVLKDKLEKEGFEVYPAVDGEDGLGVIKDKQPDIILLDILMPKMDGFTVLKKLKENPETKNVPVLLLTNLGQDEDVKKGNELGAVGYLVKANITPSEVVDKVKSLMK